MGPRAKDAKSIFLAAVENHAPDERARFVDEVCRGNAALRDQVEALLGAYAEPNSMLDGWDPQDVLQETYVRLLKGPTKLDPHRGPLEAFFHGACVRIAQERLKKAKRRCKREATQPHGVPLEEIPAPDPLADSERPSEELLAALGKAIPKLPEPLRVVIEADLEAGGTATTSDLAATLGISEATFRKRLSRARARLRELLAQDGFTRPSD